VSDALKIEKNIPVPGKATGSRTSPLRVAVLTMECGDSVLVMGKKTNEVSARLSYLQKFSGRKFTSRKVEGGVRVWRVS
jgi:hypothetical protein